MLTTGTGSGKSLSYFIPIVDDVLRRKRSGDPCKGITAIVVYPMNALCNSQLEELVKYLSLGYGKGQEPVTFARYTGQESNEDRERIAKNPPDILLTNYVMLELIMTRFLETDKAVREHSKGLRFLAAILILDIPPWNYGRFGYRKRLSRTVIGKYGCNRTGDSGSSPFS